MKRFLSLLAVMFCLTGFSQTNTPPLPPPLAVGTNDVPTLPEHVNTWLNFLSATSTNWMFVTYGLYATEPDRFGGGVAAAYSLSDYAATGLRLDYIDGEFWMPSVNIQLQLPIKVMNKLTVVPFVLSGLATPISGAGDKQDTVTGIFGGGLALRITKHADLIYDCEAWTGFPGNQHRFGFLWKF